MSLNIRFFFSFLFISTKIVRCYPYGVDASWFKILLDLTWKCKRQSRHPLAPRGVKHRSRVAPCSSSPRLPAIRHNHPLYASITSIVRPFRPRAPIIRRYVYTTRKAIYFFSFIHISIHTYIYNIHIQVTKELPGFLFQGRTNDLTL